MPCCVIVLWSIEPIETEEGIIWHSSIFLAYYFGQILRLGIGFINCHLLRWTVENIHQAGGLLALDIFRFAGFLSVDINYGFKYSFD